MYIKKISEAETFIAGDNTLLKELLNPADKLAQVRYSLAHAVVKPGQTTLPHRLKSSETYYILSGEGELNIDNEKQKIGADMLVYIPPMAKQSITNIGENDLIFLCICDPAWKKEDEIIDF